MSCGTKAQCSNRNQGCLHHQSVVATQTENKIRIRKAADHILEGHSAQATVALVAETEGVSRRTARRITAKAMDLVHRDLEAVDIQNPQLASVLIHSLMEVAAKGRETGQLGASVAALRELAAMCGVGKHNMNHRGYWRP